MIWLYRFLFFPALLPLLPYYLWRMRKRGGYRTDFSHRFGSIKGLSAKRSGVKRVWLQAVSVGEMLAIGPLLQKLVADGRTEVFLTTTTSTGYRVAKERYATFTIGIGYFPLDFCVFSARAWEAGPARSRNSDGGRTLARTHSAGEAARRARYLHQCPAFRPQFPAHAPLRGAGRSVAGRCDEAVAVLGAGCAAFRRIGLRCGAAPYDGQHQARSCNSSVVRCRTHAIAP